MKIKCHCRVPTRQSLVQSEIPVSWHRNDNLVSIEAAALAKIRRLNFYLAKIKIKKWTH